LQRLFLSTIYSPAERVRLVALMAGLILGWLTVVVTLRMLRKTGLKMKPQGELGSPITLVGIIMTYTCGVCFGRIGELMERILMGERHPDCPSLVSEVVMWTLLLTGLGPDYRAGSSIPSTYGRLGRQLGQAFALRGNSHVNHSYSSVLCTIIGGWAGALMMKGILQPSFRYLKNFVLAVLLKTVVRRGGRNSRSSLTI
jgi:hypothetical protein